MQLKSKNKYYTSSELPFNFGMYFKLLHSILLLHTNNCMYEVIKCIMPFLYIRPCSYLGWLSHDDICHSNTQFDFRTVYFYGINASSTHMAVPVCCDATVVCDAEP